MQSIIITPHEPEHVEELRDFLVNKMDSEDFNVDVPSAVVLDDYVTLKRERQALYRALMLVSEVVIDKVAIPEMNLEQKVLMLESINLLKAISESDEAKKPT